MSVKLWWEEVWARNEIALDEWMAWYRGLCSKDRTDSATAPTKGDGT